MRAAARSMRWRRRSPTGSASIGASAAALLAVLRTSWRPGSETVAVVVDAVDEAADPYRLVIELLEPLASAAVRTQDPPAGRNTPGSR